MFQFLIGRLVTNSIFKDSSSPYPFQFLIGRLVT